MPGSHYETLHPAKTAPALHIPPGASVSVKIIDSTARIQAPVAHFMHPPITGHDYLQAPAFSFLIEQNTSQRKVLFDLAMRKDWQNLAPVILKLIAEPGWNCDIKENVADILQQNAVDVASGAIEAVVWSHWHFDHTGDMTTFPGSTTLIAGAGVQEMFGPGYPANEHSPLLESDFAGREYKEIDFGKESIVQIGKFRGYDYFKDGSFYLLDAPGHAIGHMNGLARVTSTQEGDAEDTFIFMGADTAHHGGGFRPTEYLPLPKEVSPSPLVKYGTSVCPGYLFEAIHRNKKGDQKYYQLIGTPTHNLEQAEHSIELMQEFDAADNVFVIIAHDDTLLDPQAEIEWFPRGTLKNWKANDTATKVRWAFLKDFEKAVDETSA